MFAISHSPPFPSSRPPAVIILHEARREGGRERESARVQLCNCTRSIASTISPIDLRAAYLLHYYYPRLIFFQCGFLRIVYDQGDEEKECRVGGIRRSFRSILLYLFKLFTVIRNVTGKETKISNLSRIFENLLIELSGRAKRQVTGRVPRLMKYNYDRIRIERNTWEIPCPPAAVQSPCRSTDLSNFPSPPTRSP